MIEDNKAKVLREFMNDFKPFTQITTVSELAKEYHMSERTILYWVDRDVFYWEKPSREIWISRPSFDRWYSRKYSREPLYANTDRCYACSAALSTSASANESAGE